MAVFDRLIPLAARIILGLLFIPSGYGKLTRFEGFAASLAGRGLPLPTVLAGLAVACELGGSILVLLGVRIRLTALVLGAFAASAAVIGHHFWTMAGPDYTAHYAQFWKDLSLAMLLYLLSRHGPGLLAVDRR